MHILANITKDIVINKQRVGGDVHPTTYSTFTRKAI